MTYEELKREMEKYPETMSQGERAQKYAAGETVDHIPFSIQSNEEAMANIFGYTTAQWRNDVKVHIDVIKRRKEEFNIVGLASGLRRCGGRPNRGTAFQAVSFFDFRLSGCF